MIASMRTLFLTTLSLLAILSHSGRSAHASAPMNADLPNIVERVLPGVVNISTSKMERVQVYGMDEYFRLWGIPKEQPQSSLGSGFILSKDGYVMTNNHVVEGADEVLITLLNRKSYHARIVGKDQKLDIALLRIRDDKGGVPADLVALPLGDSAKTRIAEPVFAVGNPFGLQHTVTSGIISAKNRTIGQGAFDNFLQTDASINPGNSGGPLFNLKAEVIGINTSIFSPSGSSAGLGFAIPSEEVRGAIEDLKKFGRVPRPWLGLLGQSLTPQLRMRYRFGAAAGVIVANLVDHGPADRGGLKPLDVITAIEGNAVTENFEIEREIYKKKPKDTVKVQLTRERRALELEVRLDELPKLDSLPKGII